ncbi:MAG: IPT/TIG domain-containing protein, partial [Candidatus Hydrogenedentes bacterium]|nr:IPT/TIG domain-containing protein [Candidatus Hydrogenedentota bacterium]
VDNPAQGQVLLRGRTSGFLDTEVQEGVQYFYTLIADRVDGFPETEYARAIAGGVAASFTTEAFSGGSVINPTIDLAGAQLLFSPVGPPAAPIGNSSSIGTYADYEVTFTRNVFELPVPREDARGGAFLIPLTDDGGVTYLFGDRAFPFFGQLYSQVYLASNGYIGFFPVAFNSELNFPTLGAHFTIPRISYLFSDLGPNVGGTMWARGLEDRLVVTYENIPEIRLFEFGAPTTNTVQVELFYSGHIRITYQQLSTVNAIVGLSDGNGPPVDPATIFADVLSVETLTDLSAMPSTPAQLTFTPAGAQVAEAGERITFTVATVAPAGSEGVPVLTASWDGVGIVPFADNGDGTGTFNWQTELTDDGLYTLRVLATLAGEQAYQDTRLLVGETFPLPEARDLRLSTSTPGEDPTQDRVVPADTALAAEYDYFHPLATDDPELFAEGPTVLYWFRNGLVVQGLVNSSTVPASLTRGGDRWQFRVLPITESFIVGEEAVSPTVSVVELPLISSIVPGFGPTEGGTEVIIRGARLGAPLSVKFGGVEVRSVRTISSQELEVVTPIHSAGTVSVSVTTSQGTGTLRNAFIYTGDTADIVKADLNGDGKVDSTDIQIVINAILGTSSKAAVDADANRDGDVNSSDVQVVVNRALRR